MDIVDVWTEQSGLVHPGHRTHVWNDADMGRQPYAELPRKGDVLHRLLKRRKLEPAESHGERQQLIFRPEIFFLNAPDVFGMLL